MSDILSTFLLAVYVYRSAALFIEQFINISDIFTSLGFSSSNMIALSLFEINNNNNSNNNNDNNHKNDSDKKSNFPDPEN